MSDEPRPGTIAWEGGGEGRLVSSDGDALVVRSSRAYAPGSRPSGRLSPSGAELRFKTHRCRRLEEGDGLVFTVEGRLLDATRELRAELVALSTTGEPTPAG